MAGPLEFLITFMMLVLICLLANSWPLINWLKASTISGPLTLRIVSRQPVLLLLNSGLMIFHHSNNQKPTD